MQGHAAGVPTRPTAAAATPADPEARPDEHFPLLHRPPDLRGGAVDRHHRRGPARASRSCRSRVPRDRAADGRGARGLSRAPTRKSSPRRSPRRSSSRSTASRTCSTCPRRRPPTACMHADRHLRARHRPRHRAGAGAEPRRQALPKLPEEVRRLGVHDGKSSPDLTMVVHLVSPDDRYDMLYLSNYAMLQVRDELARLAGVGDVKRLRRRRLRHARLARPEKLAAREPDRRAMWCSAIREQNVQVAAGVVGEPPLPSEQVPFQLTSTPRAGSPTRRSSATSSSSTGARRPDHAAARRRPRRAGRPATTRCGRCLDSKPRGRPRRLPAPGTQRARLAERGARADGGAEEATFPQGVDYQIVYDTTLFIRESIARWSRPCSRRCCWS